MRKLRADPFNERGRDQAVIRNVMEGAKTNPKLRAEIQELGIELDLDPDVVERNIDKVRSLVARKQLIQRQLAFHNPVLKRQLEDPEFAKIAHDDLDRLGTIEALIGSLHAGMLEREQGVLENMLAGRQGDPGSLELRLGQIERELSRLPVPSGPFGEAARIAGQIVPAVPEILATGIGGAVGAGLPALLTGAGAIAAAGGGFVAGAAAGVFRESFIVNRGFTFRELRELGIDQETAAEASAVAAVPMALLDVVGAGVATIPVRMAGRSVLSRLLRKEVADALKARTLGQAARRFAGGTLAAASGEALTEALQEIPPEIAAQMLAQTPLERARLAQRDPLLARMVDVGSRVFQGMLVLGGMGAGARFAIDARDARQAQENAEVFENLRKGMEASKLQERSPRAMETFLSATVEGEPAENVYIEGERFAEVLAQSEVSREQLREVLPEAEAQLDDAVASGGDVVIPTEQFASRLAKTDLGQMLSQHARMDPRAPSPLEAQAIIKAMPEAQKEATEAVQKAVVEQAEFAASSRRVRDAMLAQIRETGRLPLGQQRAAAEAYRAFVVTQAREMGITPEEFDRSRGLRVLAGEAPAAGTLRQERAVSGLALPDPGSEQAIALQTLVDRSGLGAKDLADVAERAALGTEPGGLLKAPSFVRVLAEMRRAVLNEPKILDAIVSAVPIDVVNNLFGSKRAAKVALHDEAVLEDSPAFDAELPVTEAVDAASSVGLLVREVARLAAEMVRAAVALEPGGKAAEAIAAVSAEGRGRLRQEGPPGPRAAFDPSTLTAILFETASLDSFLHELSHYFLTIYADVASQPGAPQRIVEDMQAFLEWAKVESLEKWNAMPLTEQRKAHEAFALSMERYWFEGRAPNRKLKRLFDRVRRFIMAIYQNIRGELNDIYRAEFGEDLPILTPEIRGVMDRMVAADAAIEQAESVRSLAPMFETQEQAGASDAEWARYLQQQEDNREEALTSLAQASLKDMQWLSRARGKVLKAQQAKHNKERQRMRAEVDAEVDQEPVYLALRFLRRGEIVTEGGEIQQVEGPHKLDRELAKEILPDEDLRGLGVGKSSILAADGLRPDVVADMFGFDSGEALLRAVLDAPDKRARIQDLTDERMEATHGDLTSPEAVEAELEKALHNDARARMVATELTFLSGVTRPVRAMTAAAKAAAQRQIGAMPVRRIRPHLFAAAERRARRAAEAASKKGDAEAAILAKRNELLQVQLAAEATRVRVEIDKALKFFRKLKRRDSRIAKDRNVDMVAVGRAILFAYELGPGPTDRTPHRANIEPADRELYDALAQQVDLVTAHAQPWQGMALDDFRIVHDTVQALWEVARGDQLIEFAGLSEELGAVIEKVLPSFLARMEKRGIDPTEVRRETATRKEKRRLNFATTKAWLRHVESWAIEMDGGEPGGPVHRYLFLMLREAFTKYMRERNAIVEPIHERQKALKLDTGQKIEATELRVHNAEGVPGPAFVFKDQREVLGALLQSGNEENLGKWLAGLNLVPRPEKAGDPVDTSGWWAFFARMVEKGVITKEHMDFVQFVWDTFESLWPRTVAANMAVYGFRPPRVEVLPIQTEWGEYRGGYFPAKVDTVEALNRRQPLPTHESEVVSTSREHQHAMPSAPRGQTIARVESRPLPRILDIRLVGQLLDDHLKFIHMQKPGRDILKLINDPRLAPAIDAVDPKAREEMIVPWLNRTMQNRIMLRTKNPSADAFFSGLRSHTAQAIMFLNVRVALQQVTGFGTSLTMVGNKFLRGGLRQYLGNPRQAVAEIMAVSDDMKLRLESWSAQMIAEADTLLGPGWLGEAKKWSREHATFLQRFFQTQVDVVTWLGARDEAIAKGVSPEDAVRRADAIVRRTQGSGLAPDISRFEAGTPVQRLLTIFNSFWLATANLVYSMRDRPAQQAQAVTLVLGIVALGGAAIAKMLDGGWVDEDEDDVMWDDVMAWAFGEMLQTGLAVGIPIVGPAFAPVITGDFGGRISFGAALSSLDRATRGVIAAVPRLLTEEEKRGSDVKAVALALNLGLGLPFAPLARPVSFLLESERRDVEPTGPLDYIRGLVTGRVRQEAGR